MAQTESRRKEYRDDKRKKTRDLVISIKETLGCIDCGINDVRVLDFDHVRGDKKREISDMVSERRAIRDILNEISKCEVRCANCHRIVTHNRRLMS